MEITFFISIWLQVSHNDSSKLLKIFIKSKIFTILRYHYGFFIKTEIFIFVNPHHFVEYYEDWKDEESIWSKTEIRLPRNVKLQVCPVFGLFYDFINYFLVRLMYEDDVGRNCFFFLAISITLSFQTTKMKFRKLAHMDSCGPKVSTKF